jgi:hypothetical protein
MMMQALNVGHFLTSLARASALVLVLYALFLPFYGPLLEHHFAERQPDHEHLYLGRLVPDHVHPYQVPHSEFQSDEAESTGSQDFFKGGYDPDGIVFLTSFNGLGQGFAQLAVPCIRLSLDFPSLDETRSTLGIPAVYKVLQDAYIALPKKPPRV